MFTVLDLQRKARARLPKSVFDFIEGGAGDETAVQRNLSVWNNVRLVPKVLNLGNQRTLETKFLGQTYGAPFGVSPMGLGKVAWHDTDEGLVRATAAANIPYSLSTAGSTSIERVAELGGKNAWFQIYVSAAKASTDLMDRARHAGITTLIVTVDANHTGRRLRDLRNGFGLPFRPRPSVVVDFMRHPRWALGMLRSGSPRMVNMESSSSSEMSIAKFMQNLIAANLDWTVLEDIRAKWPGRLIVKGVMHGDDARRMVGMGVDAISVSNHGGRQLSAAVSPVEVLPGIRRAVGDTFPLLLDSGVRSGDDICKALALGANFVLLGRAFLFATAALGGAAGGPRIIDILKSELSSSLNQLGCASVHELDSSFVHRYQDL